MMYQRLDITFWCVIYCQWIILLTFSDTVLARSWQNIRSLDEFDNVKDAGGMLYLEMKDEVYKKAAFNWDRMNSNPKPLSLPPLSSIESVTPMSPPLATQESVALESKTPSVAPFVVNTSTMIPTYVIPSTTENKPSTSIIDSLPTMGTLYISTPKPSTTPTSDPSSAPFVAVDPFLSEPPPSNPDPWYFNYNVTTSSLYGPGELGMILKNGLYEIDIKNNQWGKVRDPPNNYWEEFKSNGWGPWRGSLVSHSFENICDRGKEQSPIDLRDTGEKCMETHEVRSLRGDFDITSKNVKRLVLSNKLRIVYPRRPCADLTNLQCQEPDAPQADFPNGWGGMSDLLHIDIKVPSEHLLEGKQYEAEMQLFHLHPGRRRLPTTSVLIHATQQGHNTYFQRIIDAFSTEYAANAIKCGLFKPRKIRKLKRSIGKTSLEEKESNFILVERNESLSISERQLQSVDDGILDPHHPMLVPSIWFYRYDGSLTEPPCTEMVTWFVADKPMLISLDQLYQLRAIILTNVDTNCKKTSVHYNQSVARPIRKTRSRSVSKCTPNDFGPDIL